MISRLPNGAPPLKCSSHQQFVVSLDRCDPFYDMVASVFLVVPPTFVPPTVVVQLTAVVVAVAAADAVGVAAVAVVVVAVVAAVVVFDVESVVVAVYVKHVTVAAPSVGTCFLYWMVYVSVVAKSPVVLWIELVELQQTVVDHIPSNLMNVDIGLRAIGSPASAIYSRAICSAVYDRPDSRLV